MATKEAKKWMKSCASKKHKLKETVLISWRTVSRRAPSVEKICSMQIKIFLGLDKHFYLATTSCLNHSHHLCLKSEAISHGKHDMDKSDINLLTLLFSANIQPFQIFQIMGQMKGPQAWNIFSKTSITPIRGLKNYKIYHLDWLLIIVMQRKLLQN
jgi:hypothetical protein